MQPGRTPHKRPTHSPTFRIRRPTASTQIDHESERGFSFVEHYGVGGVRIRGAYGSAGEASRSLAKSDQRPERRASFPEARKVPSCVLVRDVSRCSFAGLRLSLHYGCSRPAGRTPIGHFERPSRDGFGRQVFGKSAATGFSASSASFVVFIRHVAGECTHMHPVETSGMVRSRFRAP